MKHLKTYEDSQIGKYIIIKKTANANYNNNLDQKIGFIVNDTETNSLFKDTSIFTVMYADQNRKYFITMDEISKISDNKEELEPYIAANKYNI